MAVYKVPQDVEADDKLIGPFSFRQFIYLIVVALAIALAWGLAQVFIVLAILPLPIILLFGALALPLRKDQPMEIYLAAIVSFYLKPHRRLWDPEGVDSLIEITAPKVVENKLTKDLTQADAEQRFSYLANIVDTQGWAIRNAGGPATPSTVMNNDIILEAQGAQDMLDTSSSVGQSFENMMEKRSEEVKQAAVEHMFQAPVVTPPIPAAPASNPFVGMSGSDPVFNPYPTAIQQTVIQPLGAAGQQAPATVTQTPATTSSKQVSADIMKLANNTDLSIETIAREAHRIQDKDDGSDEVVISLR